MKPIATQLRAGALVALAFLGLSCQDPEPTPLELNGPPASLTILSGDGQTGPSGRALPQDLTVLVRDEAGQAVPAVQIIWSATGGALSAGVDSTDDDGRSTVTWTMPATPGNYVAQARVNGLATVSFSGRASPGLPFSVTIVAGSGQTVEAGQAADLVVFVGDQTGLPVPGVPVKWSTTNGRLSAPSTSTGVNGNASVRWTLPDAPGTYQAVGEVEGLSSATFTVTVSGLPSAMSVVSGDNQKNVTGTLLQPMVVAVRDKAGKPVRNIPVVWGTTGGQLTRSVDSTKVDGTASTQLRLPTTPGTYQVTATVEGLAPVQFTVVAVNPLIFRYLDAGSYHSCGITTSEELWCWGYNADGQAGNGPSPVKLTPEKVEGLQRYRAVSGGRYHTCGITLAGEVVCWGASHDNRTAGGGELTYQYVQAGETFTCGISLTKSVFCWGRNREGQLGLGSFADTLGTTPDTVSRPSVWPDPLPPRYRSVTAGAMHACGIIQDGIQAGRAYCWGYGRDGQLGIGGVPFTPDPTDRRAAPTLVSNSLLFRANPFNIVPPPPDPAFPLPDGPFIAAGFAHTCAIAQGSNQLYCWGLNESGQLGDNTLESRFSPVAISTPAQLVRITAGNSHTCGITEAGAVYCWGDNTYGQLGLGPTAPNRVATPTLVLNTGAGGLQFTYIKAAEMNTCGLTTTGVGYCWGYNEYGQLGDGTTTNSNVPRKVAFQP